MLLRRVPLQVSLRVPLKVTTEGSFKLRVTARGSFKGPLRVISVL